MTRPWQQFNHHDLHMQLVKKVISPGFYGPPHDAQAMFCPFYVCLEGKLGADWGVVVNPESTRFGLLTFEHDDCGCPKGESEDVEGWGRHLGAAQQDGDMWWDGWVHVCDDLCDQPCEMAEEQG